jgi:hypothetical protein
MTSIPLRKGRGDAAFLTTDCRLPRCIPKYRRGWVGWMGAWGGEMDKLYARATSRVLRLGLRLGPAFGWHV